ncbi:hypothetical protein Q4561_02180 [Alteromonas sp. 1_MG-2023]|uniref:hypothetical protein n=1 Tax=Alteromonas sp. 1_MG-2023 TaxID=3062669 RepID=UPI0026E2ED95|nr:hypothetical protein [Alteromonas sp. 1_MG-2023]MDO6565856.1 hypothetical protein [Alteromonas sp. 1_MG-2023]
MAASVFAVHQYQNTANLSSSPLTDLENNCTFVNEHCDFLIDDKRATAKFSEKVEPETSITILLNLPEGAIIESAWIEGVNMYMGKIPVLLENKLNGSWTGWFMLGSCSEPVMKWQLRLNIEGQAAPSYLYFNTIM